MQQSEQEPTIEEKMNQLNWSFDAPRRVDLKNIPNGDDAWFDTAESPPAHCPYLLRSAPAKAKKTPIAPPSTKRAAASAPRSAPAKRQAIGVPTPSALPLPVRSIKPLTSPHEFNLATDRRAKQHPMTLRSDAEFVSTAQLVEQFQRKTPKRFHTKAKGAVCNCNMNLRTMILTCPAATLSSGTHHQD